ncbi:MAG: hypothetical protein N4A57_00005 [Anaeromicrobium sp.]|jgi:hypothetical protein|uniref:hypothetical protein n=1 Tax=Anaeromicrobium sp. TaxID=1929132 RepID=UPI0025CC5AA2|nr:hypothetical protein [Anaeromicrobium sp.]MCT4592647.1 hypothetical protein [Anaeromicrobium sp.]
MKIISKLIFIILIGFAIYTSIQAQDTIESLEEYRTQELNPATRVVNKAFESIDESLGVEVIDSEKNKKNNSMIAILCGVLLYDTEKAGNLFELCSLGTLLWIMVSGILIRFIYTRVKEGYLNPWLMVLAVAAFLIALLQGLYLGQFVLLIILAVAIGVFKLAVD